MSRSTTPSCRASRSKPSTRPLGRRRLRQVDRRRGPATTSGAHYRLGPGNQIPIPGQSAGHRPKPAHSPWRNPVSDASTNYPSHDPEHARTDLGAKRWVSLNELARLVEGSPSDGPALSSTHKLRPMVDPIWLTATMTAAAANDQ